MISFNKQRSQPRREISAQEQGPPLKILVEDPRGAYHREINVLDINDSGMGVISLQPLKVGQEIIFDTEQDDWDLPNKGVVMWVFRASYGFRVGIKFL
ncbi:MAG TPA: PilZ domain-containing protein [Desulfobacterales bacterium]|nr:PilZ domain-containing protein [Desulfobacterales bacterium]